MAEKEKIQAEDIDLTKRNSAFNVPENEGTAAAAAVCYLNGKAVGEGSLACVKHREYICTKFGTWQDTGQKCNW
jgi:hypothetical protein